MKEKLFAERAKRMDSQKMPLAVLVRCGDLTFTQWMQSHSQASLKAQGRTQHGTTHALIQSVYVIAVIHVQLAVARRQKQVVAHLAIHHGQQLPCEFRACTQTPCISVQQG